MAGKYFTAIVCLGLVLILSTCKKEPGEGGNSTITGKIYVREYNENFTSLLGKYWGCDEDVYLIYGEGVSYDDRIRSGPEGDFVFKYLRPGDYRIYVYSADSAQTSASGKIAIYRDVEITARKQTVDAGTIVILKN